MADRASARLRVLFGQAVKLGGASFGVVRTALGADMLIDAFCRGNPPLADENAGAMGQNEGLAHLLAQVGLPPIHRCYCCCCCVKCQDYKFGVLSLRDDESDIARLFSFYHVMSSIRLFVLVFHSGSACCE